MTYSIVARDPETGNLGVAVQSHWFSVGTVVTWAESGVGAIATQSFAEPAYGPKGLALMRLGVDPATALAALTGADPDRSRRQVALVDTGGRVAVHTGDQCIEAAGHVTAEGVACQANMMRAPVVWPAMLEAYHESRGDLADRLMAALDAAEAAGGDLRGRQSAAMLIVTATSSGQPWRDRIVDLRVDDAADPLSELRRLLSVHRGYRHMEIAEEREIAGDMDGTLAAYERARTLLAGNDEATFWAAILMAGAGRGDEARALLDDITSREPGWRDLLLRLPAAGLLTDAESTVAILLGS
ncbi:MAG TPA: DUF1028 domain-containing protein [Candidatus Saccharimonadales bacterium]|nr:DUF1028 domain-containing protein [Candidatus Saccharimonadales bacterium]